MTPCPFCAGEPRSTYTGAGKKRRYYVYCSVCLARSGDRKDCTTLLEAWLRWNERPHSSAL